MDMATQEQLKPFFKKIYSQSAQVIEPLIFGYFVFGIFLSFFYDTYMVGVGVGLSCLALYFGTKLFFKEGRAHQYMASLVFGIFMAQFIYQMHGLFEMHFTAFIAIIALITYQNKYAFIPQLLFVVIHHALFAYIQYSGVVNGNEAYRQIYFTQLEYMDFQTFLFHAGLYAAGVALAAIYAHNLEQNTIRNAGNIIKLKESEERTLVNINLANDMAQGDFSTTYELRKGDKMGYALLNMRDSLQQSTARERQEKFINVGITEISEIIKNHSEHLDQLAYEVIAYLTKYLQANQGGIFILMDEGSEPYLELKGCYAYNRKKFTEKRIAPGQGLVGQCYLEKDTIHLKKVPQHYTTITSGLGEATPDNLIIIPLMNDQNIQGVLEIASFNEFSEHEIELLKRVSSNITATINSAKVNAKTMLLYEQSQEQTEQMRAQEEEMRQSMEELSSIQEEVERNAREFERRLGAINNSGIGSVEFDINGIIVDANDAFCKLMKYSKEELKGYHHRIFVDPEYAQSKEYEKFWKDFSKGIMHHGEYKRYNKLGQEVYLYGAYSVLRDSNENPIGVLKFVTDLTPYVKEKQVSQHHKEVLQK